MAGSLYLIYGSVHFDLTSGKTSLYLLQIVKGKNSSIHERKIKFVKKSKVTNDLKSEEVRFIFCFVFVLLFIYLFFVYIKLWQNKASQLKTLDTYTYLCK